MRLLLSLYDKFELVVLDQIVRAASKSNTFHQSIWSVIEYVWLGQDTNDDR